MLLEIKQVLDFHGLTGATSKAVTDLSSPGPIGLTTPDVVRALRLLLTEIGTPPFNGALYAGDADWMVVGSGGNAPAYGTGWSNGTSGHGAGLCRFRRMPDGTILTTINAKGGNNLSTLFTYPEKYRPGVIEAAWITDVTTSVATTRAEIGTDGKVTVRGMNTNGDEVSGLFVFYAGN